MHTRDRVSSRRGFLERRTRHASNRRGPPPTFCFSTRQQKSIACCSKSLLLRGYVQPLTVACQLLTTYETEPVPEQTYANVCRVVCNLLPSPSSSSSSPSFSFPHTCDAFPCQGDERSSGSESRRFPFSLADEILSLRLKIVPKIESRPSRYALLPSKRREREDRAF